MCRLVSVSPPAPLPLKASPYLEREARLIALTRALAPLRLDTLDDPAARAACWGALAPVTAAEDEEARRRSAFYWRRIARPAVPAPELADA